MRKDCGVAGAGAGHDSFPAQQATHHPTIPDARHASDRKAKMNPMKRRLIFRIAVLGMMALAGCEDAATTQELKPIPIGMMGAMNTPFITPPVIAPPTFKADEVTLPDSTIVIGVNAGGHAKCYVKEVMQPIASHVVNDTIGLTPVSITYCDQKDFVRVFAEQKPARRVMSKWWLHERRNGAHDRRHDVWSFIERHPTPGCRIPAGDLG